MECDSKRNCITHGNDGFISGFIGLIVPTFTGVIVVGVGVVTDTGGLVASGWYWNETLPWFWISPLGELK